MQTSRFRIFLIVHLLFALIFLRCDNGNNGALRPVTDEVVPAGVQTYTSGVISRSESVVVGFAEPVAETAGPTISFTPSTRGETVLEGRTLRFRPQAGWQAGTRYRATVNLPSGETFSFNFRVPERRAELITDGVRFTEADAKITVTGKVKTNDVSTVEEISKSLSATQGDQQLSVKVEALPDNQTFTYVVSGPSRGAEPAPVKIKYDGTAAGFENFSGEVSIAIPADDDFRVMDASPEDDGSLTLRLSAALKAGQDLEGIIRLYRGDGGAEISNFTASIEGNLLRIFPKGDIPQAMTVEVKDGLLNAAGDRIGRTTSWRVNPGRREPGLRAVGDGAILPHRGQRLFPFEAVGLTAVQVEIVRIYENNVTQFLQDSELGDASNEWQVSRVGRIIAQERVELSSLGLGGSAERWNRYALDLGKYLTDNSSAIYQVRIGFAMEDAVIACGVGPEEFGLQPFSFREKDEFNIGFRQYRSVLGGYAGIYGDYAGREWQDREDPCKPGYYNSNRFLSRNVISSNLGLMAKRNPDRRTVVFATDLITASPRSGVRITAFDRQRQQLFSGTTDGNGKVEMETEQAPEVIMAEDGDNVAYLDIFDQPSLPLSRFAINGTAGAGGIKGAFYTERGVWRPGDSVFLNFVLEDREQRLPANYPVTFVLRDARNRVVERRVVRASFGAGLYPLTFQTEKKDATGSWTATVEAGGRTFTRQLLIETVKPNRLSIDLELPAQGLSGTNNEVKLVSKWLYGAPATNLKANVELSVFARASEFDRWSDYVFQDPARRITDSDLGELFDGRLNADGEARLALAMGASSFPGPVSLGLATKVFEPGGNFSIDNQRISYDPYPVYAGLKIPEGKWGGKRLPLEGGGNVSVSTVTPAGEPVAGRTLNVGLYRVDWRYWWQDNYDNVARFASSQHHEALETYQVKTGSDGSANLKVGVSGWGRYLLRVCDNGGHCTGDYFYAGYNQESNDRESAALLRPVADESSVAVGDEVTVRIPTSAGGNVLLSLETGAGTQVQRWVPAESGETVITFTADASMVPTVYANITLLQPYEQTTNDRPSRLYGVIPIEVTNPETVLEPVITASDEWSPLETVSVSVTEDSGKPMTYTLAVVDEGLLGLTRFTTPNLHKSFFAKEALSVKTYDLYRYVIGSLNGDFGRVLAVGGDGAADGPDSQTANRFEPVVRHLGPFRLPAGKTGRHEITLPNYIGAVRVMVVASDVRAYGSAEERIPVRQPLMLLPTLPRVLGPGERVDMPVNVFAMSDRVKNVAVDVAESEGLVDFTTKQQRLSFTAPGNQTVFYPLTVGKKTGITRFSINGKGGGETASQEIEIDVRHVNRAVSRSKTVTIAPGETQTIPYDNFGVEGSRDAVLELSNLPALQLERHLNYLLRYPYGCAEQTISPAFAQLYLDRAVELTPEQDRQRKINVAAGLSALRKFQTSNGGIAYWPGNRAAHPWASNYAVHFLVEAERAGFSVPVNVKSKLLNQQANAARNWKASDRQYYVTSGQQRLDQAYRLYGLALAGKAEVGAMNRLRQQRDQLNGTARFQLAAAYSLIGQQQAATDLIANVEGKVKTYRELGYTFGSDVRDMAIILEAQMAVSDNTAAAKQAFLLAERVSKRNWLSTQEAAFTLAAIGKFSDNTDQKVSAEFAGMSGAATAVGANTGIYTIELPTDKKSGTGTVKNTGSATLYATVITTGKPLPGEEVAEQHNLRLKIAYTAPDGKALDVSKLPSGTDFLATYTVSNPGSLGMSYQQLALRSLVPSGWEISNERLDAGGANDGSTYDYRDIRDDGVYTFFDLDRGATKTFTLKMTATYPGRYYLPAQIGEAMYSNEIEAVVKGRWVEVSR